MASGICTLSPSVVTGACHGSAAIGGAICSCALWKPRASITMLVVGYVVMPEHVHLLVSEPGQKDLSVAIKALKQGVARRALRPMRRATPRVNCSARMRRGGYGKLAFTTSMLVGEEADGEAALHASQSSETGTRSQPRAMAMEQLPPLRLWRSRAGGDQCHAASALDGKARRRSVECGGGGPAFVSRTIGENQFKELPHEQKTLVWGTLCLLEVEVIWATRPCTLISEVTRMRRSGWMLVTMCLTGFELWAVFEPTTPMSLHNQPILFSLILSAFTASGIGGWWMLLRILRRGRPIFPIILVPLLIPNSFLWYYFERVKPRAKREQLN